MDHKDRIYFVADQLLRYGGHVFDERLLDVLDLITDVNDDMHHARHKDVVFQACKQASDALLAIAQSYEG